MTSVKSITGRAMLVGIVASLLPLYGTGFSQESAQSAPASGVATPDSRLPCPPDAKVDEDVKLIRAAYEAAYDNAKDTGEPDPLIEQLVGLSNETPDPAKKYALLFTFSGCIGTRNGLQKNAIGMPIELKRELRLWWRDRKRKRSPQEPCTERGDEACQCTAHG